jgi:two-component system sensor histidine kinase BaeS
MAQRLQDVERARRQWVADTSHELRTPLSVLRGQIEALQDGIRPLSVDHLAVMQRQIQSLSQLIDDLYQLAGADVGQLNLRKADVDIAQLVGQVFDAFREKFASAGLTATVDSLPAQVVVQGDADRLRQVFINLFENSVRYTASGGELRVSTHHVGTELRIAVDDSAPSVPAELLPRLGERFFRVEASRSRQFGGAGLGLALCRQIVEAHGGRLEFSASPLGGLLVIVVLVGASR